MSSTERKLGSIRCSFDLTGEYTSEYNSPVQIKQTNCSLFVDPPGRQVGLVLGDRISIENVKGKLVGENIEFDNQAVWTKDASKKHSLDKEQVMVGLSRQVVEAVKHPNPKHPSGVADGKAKPFWETLGIGLAISSSATAIGGLAAGIAAHEAQEAYQQKRAAAKKASEVVVVEVQVATESSSAPSSSLAEFVQAGAKSLPVASQGFAVGAQVVIDQGKSVEEVVEIVGFGSLILKHATKYPHGAGASLTLLPAMASKSVGASAEAKLKEPAAAGAHSSWEGTSSHVLIGVALSLSVLTVLGGATAFYQSRPKKMTSLGAALSTTRTLSRAESEEYSRYSGEEEEEQEESEEEAHSLVKPWTADQGLDIWASSHSRLAVTPYILDPPSIDLTAIAPTSRLSSWEELPSREEP